MKGKAFLLGNNVSGDQIISGMYLSSGKTLVELKDHLFEDLRDDFPEKNREGNVIIAAGENFGCGSSREMVILLMKEVGIKCVVAKSFSRNFYRNGINMGILPVICQEVIKDGDTVEVDLDNSQVVINENTKCRFVPFPERVKAYIEEGSLLNYYKKHHTI